MAAHGVTSARADLAGFAQGSYTANVRSPGGFTPSVSGNSLTLTSAGQGFTATSVFFDQTQNVSAFTARFDYHVTSPPVDAGDGFAFVLQNDPLGRHALGGEGNGLGYARDSTRPGGPSIGNSFAVRFNLYAGSRVNNGPGTQIGLDGSINHRSYLDVSPIDLLSGNLVHVYLSYDGRTLSETLRQAGQSVHTSYEVDLAGLVGGSHAYLGFSGADGRASATQVISNFSFSPVPEASPLSLVGVGAAAVIALSLRRRRRWQANLGR